MILTVLVFGISLYHVLFVSSKKAFLNVYLPCLFLLPQSFVFYVQGIPEASFSQAAALPILITFVFLAPMKLRINFIDVLVVLGGFWGCLCKFHHEGYWIAQDKMFDVLTNIYFPYFAIRIFIKNREDVKLIAKRVAIFCFANVLLFSYEFFMHENLYHRVFDSFFPRIWHGAGLAYRNILGVEIPRYQGPYIHSILGGLAGVIAYRFSRWLQWSDLWEKRFKFFHVGSWSKGTIISLALLGGVFLSGSRGPWIGGLAGWWICGVGRSFHPKRTFKVRLVWAIIFLCIFGPFIHDYISSKEITSGAQSTAYYRYELWKINAPLILERPFFGWAGKVVGKSADNAYLIIGLRQGLVGLLLFLTVPLLLSFRLLRSALRSKQKKPLGGNVLFTMLGIQLVLLATFATVWIDPQMSCLFFLMMGCSENCLAMKRQEASLSVRRRPIRKTLIPVAT